MKSFLKAFIAGDPKIYREIYYSEASNRIRLDVKYKGGTPDEAEDVLVLAIMKVKELVKQGKYKDQEKFYGYLRTVASYVHKEEWKKIYKAPHLEKEVLLGDDFNFAEKEETELYAYEEEMEDFENKIRIQKSINSLGARDQEIIRLRYFEDLSLLDIGRRLGISQPNVAHFRALKRLKKLIGKKKGQ